jgi:hypothetical protein
VVVWWGWDWKALKKAWCRFSSVAIRTQWPDSFQLRSGSQKAAMHRARMSSSVCARSNMLEAMSSRSCWWHLVYVSSMPGMCKEETVMMAVKRRDDDSRMLWRLRSSEMVAL